MVGELLWLVTRTRPDLAFTTSRMAQMVLKCPRMVAKMADQVWRYLRTTRNEDLSFQPTRGTGWAGESQIGLEAFSDASFAPGGGTSVGAVMIRWNGALMHSGELVVNLSLRCRRRRPNRRRPQRLW